MTQSKSDRTEKRRQILRAAASAPIILTLPSGAALAATSMTCAQKSQTLAQTVGQEPVGVAAAPDTWMRFEVQVVSFKGSVSVTASTFLDASATSSNGASTASSQVQKALYLTLNGQWYRVLTDGTAEPVTLTSANGKPLAELGTPEGTRYVLVDYAAYSAGGSPTLYVYPAATPVINPISGVSCWNSLTGANLTSTVIN